MERGGSGAGFSVEAGNGLRLVADAGGSSRLEWRGADWLGPAGLRIEHAGRLWAGPDGTSGPQALQPDTTPIEGEDALGPYRGVSALWPDGPLALRTEIRGYPARPVLVFRIEALADLEGLGTGSLAAPSVAWPWWRPDRRRAGSEPAGLRAFGHQLTEFAFPTFGGPGLDDFFLFPHRPAVLAPLLLSAAGGSLLLAPLDAFHEQVLATPQRNASQLGLRCGWHGDLQAVPRGFSSELSLWAGPGPRALLEAWGGHLRERYATRRPSRYADACLGRLSYWTDNGASYWYRTEPGLDVGETLGRVAEELRSQQVPVAAYELDSWFYPHQLSRPVNPEGQEHVPPTGMLRWEAREDALPEGVAGLRRRLGDPPLILHTRHFSGQSDYFEELPAWLDGDRGHPADPRLFERLAAQAAAWGADTLEQDWLIELFLGVRELRSRPGRSRAWQEAFDRAAAEHGLSLLWCMASPADFFQTLRLARVGAIRTSGDYRYLATNAVHWTRFLYTNCLARALGLWPFKDVFLSEPGASGRDGDPLAEAEALLAALSAGPVGIGDRLGRTNRAVVMRCCRSDGVLVKPDVPIAALDRSFRRDAFFEPEPLVAETYTRHGPGRWIYLASFNAWRGREPLRFEVALSDLGAQAPREPVVAYDWRRRSWSRLAPEDRISLELEPDGWDYRILCPLLPGGAALLGDPALYASAGDRRLAGVESGPDGIRLEAWGAPGERIELEGWSEREPRGLQAEVGAGLVELPRHDETPRPTPAWGYDPSNGVLRISLEIPDRGWVGLRLRPA